MSNDLKKRLRDGEQAANYIKQLERQLDAMQDRLDAANMARAGGMYLALKKQYKLAKAVETLRWYADFGNYLLSGQTYPPIDLDKGGRAEDVLAELEVLA